MKESSNVKKHIKAYTRYIEELRFQLFKKKSKTIYFSYWHNWNKKSMNNK